MAIATSRGRVKQVIGVDELLCRLHQGVYKPAQVPLTSGKAVHAERPLAATLGGLKRLSV
jgi:hypothetical protein